MTVKGIQISETISTEKEELIFERFCSLGNPTEEMEIMQLFIEQYKEEILL